MSNFNFLLLFILANFSTFSGVKIMNTTFGFFIFFILITLAIIFYKPPKMIIIQFLGIYMYQMILYRYVTIYNLIILFGGTIIYYFYVYPNIEKNKKNKKNDILRLVILVLGILSFFVNFLKIT